ncbi:hypothetical protein [Pseudomonas fluorescens]|uniref:hypothetical protein n=1 Tax=Pseudomonas fluorescens TaxID=294 RepID=UPI0012419370|nr:hypothetical protein [Pseudomonas fluorescens]VVQ28191.1 hypothetical protein PS947_00767 [Pseudomonas fluorescens]
MTDKRFAIQMLPAPVLKEAINDVLYVHNLIDPAHGVVPALQEAAAGDKITLKVYDSDGAEEWSGSVELTSISAGKPVELAIPKAPFEKMLKAGKNAGLQYYIERAGTQKHSMQRVIELKD